MANPSLRLGMNHPRRPHGRLSGVRRREIRRICLTKIWRPSLQRGKRMRVPGQSQSGASMIEDDQKSLAWQTYERVSHMLPREFREALSVPEDDPAMGQKTATKNVAILRVLPVLRKPVKFWSATAGYYEIGVGPYGRDPHFPFRCLGAVQFFHHPGASRLGKGNHSPGITEILRDVARQQQGRGFVLSTPDEDGKFHFQKRYAAAHYPGEWFPCETAAADFCWLVTVTLPRFWRLAGG